MNVMRVRRSLWGVLVWVLVTRLACAGGVYGDERVGETAGQDVAFTASVDGTTQHYVVVLPPGFQAAEKHSLLIALHGHGADRWQFVREERDECRAVRDVARKHNLILVSPDYRARTSWMGPAAEADLVQIIAELKTSYSIEHVFLCGGSMGGTSSLAFAALHPDLLQGVAAMNGTANLLEYENFQDAISASYGGTKVDRVEEYKRRSAEYWPERLTMPVSMTTSGKDTIVPPQSVLRLAGVLKILQRPVLLIHRPDADHATNYEDATAILEFILKPA
jgi:pimeloyl-ACP methyl ester carboxylesterase